MQKWSYNIIGTHLAIALDTEEDCSQIFHDIEIRLQDFEAKFSRFISDNWLHSLNISRRAILDDDAREMLQYALEIAQRTDGYFDPTVGKRLTELGYGVTTNQEGVIMSAESYGDYRDIEVVGDEVIFHGDILLEFGGVGKGYLIDVIKDIIDRYFHLGSKLQVIMEGEWSRFSPGKGGVRGGYTEYNPSLLEHAKENRKQTNDMEKNMWFLLRGEKTGHKFHRQKPIGEYIVDFYSPSLQLVIEIDGESHLDNLQYDKKRTVYLNLLGIHVLRFTNSELLGSLEGVQENIGSWIKKIEEHNKVYGSITPPNLPFSGEAPEKYLINFGGDMYGRGGWKVGLESPFAPDEVIGTYTLDNGFLACSAGTRRKWAGHHHLIDPHTGESAREVVASYVEGSSGISVDSYATALCVMPWDQAVDTLKKTPEISGVIVKHDGTLFQKEGSGSVLFS